MKRASGGAAGDLYVVLRVREHPYFDRQGNDLYCTIPISITQAILGAEIKIPSTQGPGKAQNPRGNSEWIGVPPERLWDAQCGRAKGRGFVRVGSCGDPNPALAGAAKTVRNAELSSASGK